MGQGYSARLDETIAGKDGAESTKDTSMTGRRHESEAMEKKDHGHKYGSDAHMSYRDDASNHREIAMSKVLKHMGGRGLSVTDRGIEGLGDPNVEGRFI